MRTMPERETVNGINVKKLAEMTDAMQVKPDLGKFTLRARNKWVHGTHSSTTIQNFYGAGKEDTSRGQPFVVEADEPQVLLGGDRAPNATEYLLHALAACLNASFMYLASARGVQVGKLELDLEGDFDLRGILGLADNVRNGFQEIRVTFHVQANAPRQEIEELCQLAQKRSPVFDSVAHPVSISVRVEAA
jgi:uncharacterized OsmC-like protein